MTQSLEAKIKKLIEENEDNTDICMGLGSALSLLKQARKELDKEIYETQLRWKETQKHKSRRGSLQHEYYKGIQAGLAIANRVKDKILGGDEK